MKDINGLFLSDVQPGGLTIKKPRVFGCSTQGNILILDMRKPADRYSMQEEQSLSEVMETLGASGYNLVVWNDEVNTFDWVIETLVEVCGHSAEQAEQCAMIIHTRGKYAVKNGSYSQLKPQCDAITDRLINATVEQSV